MKIVYVTAVIAAFFAAVIGKCAASDAAVNEASPMAPVKDASPVAAAPVKDASPAAAAPVKDASHKAPVKGAVRDAKVAMPGLKCYSGQ